MMRFRTMEWREIVRLAFDATPAERRLREHSAVVLERIARGAGAVRWYWIRSPDDLERLTGRLFPGSVVSFYFDSRIKRQSLDDEVDIEIIDIVVDTGDAVVGTLSDDGLEIIADVVAGPMELTEFQSEHDRTEPVFFGPFPGRDNDGVNAITLILPDADGVVRDHPH